jgi:hypothetical protein
MYKEIKLKRTKKLKKHGNKRKNIKNHKLTKAGFQKSLTQTEAGFQKSRAQTESGFQKSRAQTEAITKQQSNTKQLLEKIEHNHPLKISRTQIKKAIEDEALAKGGGSKEISKEKFEVKRLSDIDYSQFSLSRYLDTNIDWGTSPGPPPTDCCIM